MATTRPTVFVGRPKLTDEKLEIIDAWYLSCLRNEDVCTDVEDGAYYQGGRQMAEDILTLLYMKTRPSIDVFRVIDVSAKVAGTGLFALGFTAAFLQARADRRKK